MKKRIDTPLFIIILILMAGLVGCDGVQATPEPTETAVFTATPIPTAAPHATAEPTAVLPPVTISTDGSIAYGERVEGGIVKNGRSQWTFNASKGDEITLIIAPATGFDAVVDIINTDGDSILPTGAIDDSFAEETVNIQLPDDGEYSILIFGYEDSNGRYQLLLSNDDEMAIEAGFSSNSNGTISQWASRTSASSEFSNDSWAAFQAEGAPDTLECGDLPTAWAAANSKSVEWIELYYETAVVVTELNIHQSYTPDQVVSVALIATSGENVPIFTQTQIAEENCPYILSLTVESDFPSDGVRITIDQSALSDWTEIDAVELIGIPADGTSHTPDTAIVPEESSIPEETAVATEIPSPTANPPVNEPVAGVLWRNGGLSGYKDEPIGHLEGVAYDAERSRLYVTDSFNSVMVLDKNGVILDEFKTDSTYFSPSAVDVDANGNIYVTNNSFSDEEGRIIVFSPEGSIIHAYGNEGTGDGEFGILSPASIAVAADGTTYALDSNKDSADETIYRIYKFSPDGSLQAVIPINPDYSVLSDTPLIVGADGFLYLAEWLNGRIIKMDEDGNVIKEINRGDAFFYPSVQGLDVDAAGNIYVAVWDEPVIIKLDQDGNELATFGFEVENGAEAWDAGGFYWPNSLAVSPNGDTVYVTDWSGDYAYLTAVDMR